MYFYSQYKIFSTLVILLFIPSFFYVFLNASSMAAGIAFAMAYILIVSKKMFPRIRISKLLFWIVIVSIHYAIAAYIFMDHFSIKHLLSFSLLGLMILAAGMLSLEIKKLKPHTMLSILKILSFIVLIIGIYSLIWKVNIFGYSQYVKSIFPFSEPSHFALSVGGLLFATGLYFSMQVRIYLIIIVGLMGILYPNLTLLVVSLIMILLYFVSNFIKLLPVILLVSLSIFYVINFTDMATYFFDRLTFGDSASNLTALVYLQGWEDMRIALHESYGFGVGFQNMGILPPGEYGDMIYRLAGKFKNRNDGGFLAAKIVGELGVLGIGLIIAYLFKLFHSIIYIINFTKFYDLNKKQTMINYPIASVLGHSIIIMFFLEMFTRGYGYFSTGVFLFFVAIFLTSFENRSLFGPIERHK